MKKIFLGGTCNESNWRDILIEKSTMVGLNTQSYFNPVVDDWTPDCAIIENKMKKECDFCLYVITPLMTGVYSIAELVDDSNKRPSKTLFCILKEDGLKTFNESQSRSLEQVKKLVIKNGVKYFKSIDEIVEFLKLFE